MCPRKGGRGWKGGKGCAQSWEGAPKTGENAPKMGWGGEGGTSPSVPPPPHCPHPHWSTICPGLGADLGKDLPELGKKRKVW